MSAELIAVNGCQFKFTDASGAPATATIRITSQPSQKVKAEGNGVYVQPLTFTLSLVTTSKITNGDGATTAPGSMSATAEKTKAGSVLVMRQGDSVDVAVTGSAGQTKNVTDTVTVEISDAGQKTVKGA